MSTTRSASTSENEMCERDCCYCSVSQPFHTLTSKHKQRHVYYYVYNRHVRYTKSTTNQSSRCYLNIEPVIYKLFYEKNTNGLNIFDLVEIKNDTSL